MALSSTERGKARVADTEHGGPGRVSTDGPHGWLPRSWRESLRAATLAWLVGYVCYITFTLAVSLAGGSPSWHRWDSVWYGLIARHGYLETGQEPERAAAFLPLYPLLVRGADAVLPVGVIPAGQIVSAVAYLAALTVLHRLAAREFGQPAARSAVFGLAAFPTAFFLAVGYSMSLALFLLVTATYAMRARCWWLGAAIAGLATATRTSAVLLVLVFGWEYVRRFGWRPRPVLLAAVVIPAGLAGFAGYLWLVLGDPLAFAHAQRFWKRSLDVPWAGPSHAAGLVLTGGGDFDMRLYNAIDLTAVLFMVVIAVYAWRRLPVDQRIYPILLGGFVAVSVCFPAGPMPMPLPLKSAARLALEAFPAYLLLGVAIGRGRVPLLAIGAIGVLGQILLFGLYLEGRWAG